MPLQIFVFSALAAMFIVQGYNGDFPFLAEFLHHFGLLLQSAQKGLHDLKVVGAANRIGIHITPKKSGLLIAGHIRSFRILGVVAKNQDLAA